MGGIDNHLEGEDTQDYCDILFQKNFIPNAFLSSFPFTMVYKKKDSTANNHLIATPMLGPTKLEINVTIRF